MPSTAAAHFEEALQSPAYAEAYHRSEDRADGFAQGTRGASAGECIADERQSECPDPNSEFHSREKSMTLLKQLNNRYPTPTEGARIRAQGARNLGSSQGPPSIGHAQVSPGLG